MKKIFFLIFTILIHSLTILCWVKKPMVLIVPSYNNEEWIENNLRSIFLQEYSNYRVVYIDDCSSDATAMRALELAKKYNKTNVFTLIKNQKRQGALANLYSAIHECCDDEIIVTIDGDDWLAHSLVLNQLNEVYCKKNVWITHGSFIETVSLWDGWGIGVPEDVVRRNAFREFRCPSHLRTFYAGLFKKIKKEDLIYNDEFFPMAWDQAMLFPMFEMAAERHEFMEIISYVYNTTTSFNDNKIDRHLQSALEAIIRHRPAYQRLNKL